jgi:hypothetical protein
MDESAANKYRWTAHHDVSAMYRRIAHPGCWQVSNRHGRGTRGDHIRRTNTSQRIRLAGCWQPSDHDGDTGRRQNRTANVRHNSSGHWANMKIRNSGGGRHDDTTFRPGISDRAFLLSTCAGRCQFCLGTDFLLKAGGSIEGFEIRGSIGSIYGQNLVPSCWRPTQGAATLVPTGSRGGRCAPASQAGRQTPQPLSHQSSGVQ